MRSKIKDLMTGLADIAVVDENSTLFEAILEIGIVRNRNPGGLRCPAALVVDAEHNVAGFLDFRSMLKGLEPKYGDITDSARDSGFPPGWVKSELEKYGLYQDVLEIVCRKAGDTMVKGLMSIPDEAQITDAEASISEAIYQMIATGRDYLFVKNGRALTGVISLSDVMSHLCDTVKACRM